MKTRVPQGKTAKRRITGRQDFITERAAYMAYRNSIPDFPRLPTLGVASHFRQEALRRKLSGRPLLG